MIKQITLLLCAAASAFAMGSCSSRETDLSSTNPFDTTAVSSNQERNKILVISDLHLGNDLSYSETVHHLGRLEAFLKEVRSSKTIKELVIAGDMFDDWYIPTRTDTYGSGTPTDFIRKTVAANQRIFDVLNGIIGDRKVKVTYIPGNHDMNFTSDQINAAMPGVNQARDIGKYAVGTYFPEGYPQIAIEHSHRYDFFCAMTPNANETEAPGSILPPGYFFARIAANSFTDPTTQAQATPMPSVVLNNASDPEENSKHIYYSLWKKVMEDLIYVKDDFSEPIIRTNVGNFTRTYAINDIIPRNAQDGSIQMNLYNGLFTQSNWDAREQYNNVMVMTEIDQAIVGSLRTSFLDTQSYVQYFNNQLRDTRVVVFGHTHLPMLKSHTNSSQQPCIYANSGTWEDRKTRDRNAAIDQDSINMHFVLISPKQSNSQTIQVGLYQYRYGKHVQIDRKEIDL